MSEEGQAKTQEEFSIPRLLGGLFAQLIRNFFVFAPVAAILAGGAHYFLNAPALFALTGLQVSLGPFIAAAIKPFLEMTPVALAQGFIARVTFNGLTGRGAGLGIALAATAVTAFWLVLFSYLALLLQVLGTLVLVAPGLIVMVRLSVGAPAIVIEGIGPLRALRRSWDLTEGDCSWAIFGLLILSGLASFSLSYALRFALTGQIEWLPTPAMRSDLHYLALESGVAAFSAMVTAAGAGAVYVELLRVKEGGGAQELASTFD
jgi:hypothetical protein